MIEQQKQQGMSLADFTLQYEQQPFELIDGEVIPMAPLKYGHTRITKQIYDRFFLWTHLNKGFGTVFSEGTFVLEDQPDWVKGSRAPDVMFYIQKRLDEYHDATPNYQDKPIALVPDIVVEVIFPTDKYSDVVRKVEVYLEDGVKIVWVVDPKRQSVAEYTQANPNGVTRRNDDILSGGEIATGFELKVSEIFE